MRFKFLAFGVATLLTCGTGTASAAAVARVSMAVGDVTLVRPGGNVSTLARGAEVSERDRIVTGRDGMAMLVFMDQGRVAIRPESELLIRQYVDDASGRDTQLHFELMRGTVRQISGDAAHRQPDRYRLNTPIAVIGVRGTDFLAKSDASVIQTYVHEGAITVQPVGTGMPLAAPTLSVAGEANFMQAAGDGSAQLRRLQADEADRLFSIRLGSSSTAVAQSTGAAGTSARRDGSSSGTASAAGNSRSDATSPVPGGASSATAQDSTTVAVLGPSRLNGSDNGKLPSDVAISGVIRPIVPTPIPLPKDLVWGRFSDPLNFPLTLPLPFQEASANRQVTIGEPTAYALWRAGGSLLPSVRGTADFALAAGESYYSAGGTHTAVNFSDPRLQVDFDRARFSTSLGLSGVNVPTVTLGATGTVGADGMFVSRDANGRVAGALNATGTEAGYLFQLTGANGQYNGITLWNRK